MIIDKRVFPKHRIIRVRDSLNVAETVNGKRVYRSDKIYFPEWEREVVCAPYMEHFIFEDRSNIGWTLFCSCGSPAVISGYKAYARDASPSSGGSGTIPGELLVCYHHAQFNKHLDGVG